MSKKLLPWTPAYGFIAVSLGGALTHDAIAISAGLVGGLFCALFAVLLTVEF